MARMKAIIFGKTDPSAPGEGTRSEKMIRKAEQIIETLSFIVPDIAQRVRHRAGTVLSVDLEDAEYEAIETFLRGNKNVGSITGNGLAMQTPEDD